MATIRDVAKLAGVSVATVSRAINQNGYVNKETESRILDSIKKLNYTPNTLARGLAGKKTNTIALIVPDITNLFFSELARAVEDAVQSIGYTLILCNSDYNGEKELQYIEILKNRYIDGIIFTSHQLRTREVKELKKLGIPTVVLDRAAHSKDIFSIHVNHYEGAVLAVEHLLSIGCKRIAHISGPMHLYMSAERTRGYVETLEKKGLFNPSYFVQGDFTLQSGLEMTFYLLDKHPNIDGIFAANDSMAIGVLKAVIRSGIKVPDQIAIIGFDGISMMTAIEPEVTTIAQPISEMGALAVQSLIRQIENRETLNQKVETLEVKLIQRKSTMKRIHR